MIGHKSFVRLLGLVLLCFSSCASRGQDIPKKVKKEFAEAYRSYKYQEYDKAESGFKKIIKKYPNFVDPYDALAKTYQEQGKDKAAIATYRRALEISPNHYFSLYELGGLYIKTGRLDSAQHFYTYFLKEHADKDENTAAAKRGLQNIKFITQAVKNPSEINPVSVGKGINTPLEQYSPALTLDEQTMFITHRDPKYQNEDIFYSTKKDDVWTKAKPIGPPINTADNEGAFSVSADGRYIFFTACSRPGGLGQCDIWLTINKNGSWSEPQNLGPVINSRAWESQPSLSSDGRDLYFTSNRSGGYGGMDLYKSTFTESGWSKPVNLGPEINTAEDEQFPFIHPDGSTLYFGSVGHPGMGRSDLFVSHKLPDNKWEKPQNLGFPINTVGDDWNIIVSRDGETAYYSSNSQEDGVGGMDIYTFKLPKSIQAKRVNYAKGIVRDAESKSPIGAIVQLTPLNGGEASTIIAPSRTGTFMVALTADVKYALTIEKDGYLFHSESFDMPNSSADEPFNLDIYLQKIKTGERIVLKNVFFDTDRFDLKLESYYELDKLQKLLADNSSMTIEISGHTDNKGSASHNKTLSENRAKAVRDYLVSKGISSSRMTFVGYGQDMPIASNDTEEGRAQNRRTEFKITK